MTTYLQEAMAANNIVAVDKELLRSVIALLQSSQKQAGGVDWAKERDALLLKMIQIK